MRKMINIIVVLMTALFFTGCAKDTLSKENTDKTEPFLDVETQEEVKEEHYLEEVDDVDEKYNTTNQQEELSEVTEIATVKLSDEEMAKVQLIMEEYYISINRRLVDFVQADPTSPIIREYEGYGSDEVVFFEVSVENSENKRYIAIGSNDGWNNCSVLNEGY